jgi:hypothetical protein
MREMPETKTFGPPLVRNVHTVEECDVMLALQLDSQVADAWLDERLSCMRALALIRDLTDEGAQKEPS